MCRYVLKKGIAQHNKKKLDHSKSSLSFKQCIFFHLSVRNIYSIFMLLLLLWFLDYCASKLTMFSLFQIMSHLILIIVKKLLLPLNTQEYLPLLMKQVSNLKHSSSLPLKKTIFITICQIETVILRPSLAIYISQMLLQFRWVFL